MSLLNDLRLAARVLVKDRRLTFAAGTAIALGIAATTTVFTIANAAILRDMPFTDPDRVVSVEVLALRGGGGPATERETVGRSLSYLDFGDLRERAESFADIAAWNQRTMNVSEDALAPDRFQGAIVTANTFSLIGHRPELGRDFGPQDEQIGAEPVVILGHDVWRTRYRSDPGVIGRRIRINGVPSTVIGVMAERFKFPFSADLWVPVSSVGAELRDRNARSFVALARLKDGVTLAQANEDLARVLAAFGREYPTTHADLRPNVALFRAGAGPQIWTVMYALLGAVAFLLLIACANVANLLLARSVDRSREVSVRMAIGASRWQIIRQLLTESLLLSVISSVVGFALAIGAVRLFTNAVTGTGEPYWLDFSMDLRVVGFFAAACVGTAIVFGLAPALHTSNLKVSEMLNESGRGSSGTLRARRWAGALVVLQLALAPVLLAGAGLMMRTLVARYQQDPGIAQDGLTIMRLDLSDRRYETRETRRAFFQLLDERLAAAPGLRVALASNAPTGGGRVQSVEFEGRPETGNRRPDVSVMTVGPRYFAAVGASMIRGREFAPNEAAGEIPAIINARFAELHFSGRDPLGARVRLIPLAQPPNGAQFPEWVTVVGVASNVRQRDVADGGFDPILYVPFAEVPAGFATILGRSNADASSVARQVREIVRALDSDLPIFDVVTFAQIVAADTWPFRVFGSMFATFAIIAFFLASVGLYAVTARSVAQRTREIGVRMALGAEAREIWWTVTRRATIQLAIGLVIGMAGAVGVGQLLLGTLVTVSPTDPITFVGVPVLLTFVGFVASLIPARRAMRLDPVTALRHE